MGYRATGTPWERIKGGSEYIISRPPAWTVDELSEDEWMDIDKDMMYLEELEEKHPEKTLYGWYKAGASWWEPYLKLPREIFWPSMEKPYIPTINLSIVWEWWSEYGLHLPMHRRAFLWTSIVSFCMIVKFYPQWYPGGEERITRRKATPMESFSLAEQDLQEKKEDYARLKRRQSKKLMEYDEIIEYCAKLLIQLDMVVIETPLGGDDRIFTQANIQRALKGYVYTPASKAYDTIRRLPRRTRKLMKWSTVRRLPDKIYDLSVDTINLMKSTVFALYKASTPLLAWIVPTIWITPLSLRSRRRKVIDSVQSFIREVEAYKKTLL